MKRFFTIVIFYGAMFFSDVFPEEIALVPYRAGNLCGYSDRELNIMARPRYMECGAMTGGMARVMKGGKYGFVDNSGREVIPARYSHAENFHDGGAIVKYGGMSGVVNRRGDILIPFTPYSVSCYSQGKAVVSKDNVYGLMDGSGRLLLPLKFAVIEPVNSSLFITAEKDIGSLRYFLYRSNGELALKEEFDLIYLAGSGFLVFKKRGKWGYMNSSGAVIVPAIYDSIRNVKRDGTSAFRVKEKWGILDGTGKVIVKPVYDSIGGGEGPAYERAQADDKWFLVSAGGRFGLLSSGGEVIAGTDYAMIGDGRSGYFPAFRETGKNGNVPVNGLTILDSSGWELFTPRREYNCAGDESEGLLPAGRISGRGKGKIMGYINHHGEEVISMQYEEAGSFSGGYAIVKRNGLYGVIDRSGREVERFVYDSLSLSTACSGLLEGIIAGRKIYFEPGGKHYFREK